MKKIFTLIFIILCVVGCKNTSENYLMLGYEDFGPQAMAWEAIGMQWWQWEDHGDSNPENKYDIKIVVYQSISLKEIQALFPVVRVENKDFRYIEYDDSIKYLNKNINELNDINEDWTESLQERLVKTQYLITQKFRER